MSETVVRRATEAWEIAALKTLRIEVFVREQGVPEEEELDVLDDTALHAVAVEGGSVIGTGRLLDLGGGEGQIGRMAMAATRRREGIGGRIIGFLEGEARMRGDKNIVLHAQTYVAEFYRRHGYVEEGNLFTEAGIEHVSMRKQLV